MVTFNCVQLPYLRHLSLVTKIHGLLQLIIICTLHNCAISIDSYSPINKFYSFIIFSLLINAVILLMNCLVLILHLYIHFLSLRHYFLYLNIIWTFICLMDLKAISPDCGVRAFLMLFSVVSIQCNKSGFTCG